MHANMLMHFLTAVLTLTLLVTGSVARATQAQNEYASTLKQSNRTAMSKSEFQRFLKHLAADTIKWKAEFETIDIASLRPGYQEGKEIEAAQRGCVEDAREIQTLIPDLLQKQTVTGDISLLIMLQLMHSDVDRLADWINDSLRTSNAESVDFLFHRITAISDEIGSYFGKMVSHTLALASLADVALERAGARKGSH
jgi:hypothetical protein